MGLTTTVILVTTLLVALCSCAAIHERKLREIDSKLGEPNSHQQDKRSYLLGVAPDQYPKQERETPANPNSYPPHSRPSILGGPNDTNSYAPGKNPENATQIRETTTEADDAVGHSELLNKSEDEKEIIKTTT